MVRTVEDGGDTIFGMKKKKKQKNCGEVSILYSAPLTSPSTCGLVVLEAQVLRYLFIYLGD